MGFAKWFDEQDKVVKCLLLFPFWGWIFGFLYRLFKFIETKENPYLVGFILCVVPFVGFVLSIVDFVTMIIDEKFRFFVAGGDNFGLFDEKEIKEAKEETKEENTEETTENK